MPFSPRLFAAALAFASLAAPAAAQELSSAAVKRSIERGVDALMKQQNADGSFSFGQHTNGATAICTLALLNAGRTAEDPAVAAGLEYLRDQPPGSIDQTYDCALTIMAFVAAKDGRRDQTRLLALTRALERGQTRVGPGRGAWYYRLGSGGADRSNSQYAVLGLRDAAYAGIPVSRKTWENVANYWVGPNAQNRDGSWGYMLAGSNGTGSMTVAGIATVSILKTMLREDDLNPDGTPNCCGRDRIQDRLDRSLVAGVDWLTRTFTVQKNPDLPRHHLYYLYGLERAGRLSGRRFFGEHDWYREGAAYLVRNQDARRGVWKANGQGDADPAIGTAYALLFLSKGLSPVLLNKLKFGPGDDWRRHPGDAQNLVNHVSGLPKWPKLVTWQTLDLAKATAANDVAGALSGPVTLMTGSEAPDLTDAEVAFLRDYVDSGGFLLGVQTCTGDAFGAGFRDLVKRMYPEENPRLERLGQDHPVFRAEYLLDATTVELYGADLGCRTPIMFSPVDLSCYWDLWTPYDPPDRDPQLVGQIAQKVQTGVNVLAYATGREPPDKLARAEQLVAGGARDEIERGLLQVAKLRHEGEWDAAPRALRNLLIALNTTAGVAASTEEKSLVPADPNVFRYPVLYMHGRGAFSFGDAEKDRLRTYLKNGGVLFADACCGSEPFDRSFRQLMRDLFPDAPFDRLPPDHELFTERIGFDLARVRRRVPGEVGGGALEANVVAGEPFLEGVTVGGQVAVIYSKFDVSCALERQTTVACAGYVPEDALKIGINVLRYALLRDPVPAEPAR